MIVSKKHLQIVYVWNYIDTYYILLNANYPYLTTKNVYYYTAETTTHHT